MGKVMPGGQISSQKYQIGVPVPKKELSRSMLELPNSDVTFDIEALLVASHRIVDDSSNDARFIVNEARDRAKTIVGKALEMAAELEQKGYDDGLERAHQEQEEAMRTVVQEAKLSLHRLIETIRGERRQFFRDAEKELLDLALEISKKIIQHELSATSDVAVSVTRSALKRLSERDQVTIRVSPDDLECIREHRDEFLHEADIGDLRIVADPRVDRGGAIIETNSGSIDGRIDSQLEVAKEALQSTVRASLADDAQ